MEAINTNFELTQKIPNIPQNIAGRFVLKIVILTYSPWFGILTLKKLNNTKRQKISLIFPLNKADITHARTHTHT